MSQITPNCHFMSLQSNYWTDIEKERKTIEGRIYDKKRAEIMVNHTIQFSIAGDPTIALVCKVVEVNIFTSFEKMLATNEGLKRCLPGVATVDKGIGIYHSFPNYAEREESYGVVAFRIKYLLTRNNPKDCPLLRFPDTILQRIFQYLPVQEVARARTVCYRLWTALEDKTSAPSR